MTNSKQKGKRGELELANKLKEYGYDCRRTAQYNGKELESKADVVGLPGIHIEVKRVEKLNIHDAIQQAIRDCKGNESPAVFHRKNGTTWLVTMELEDWMKMYAYKEALDQVLEENDTDYVCDVMSERDDFCEINCHATRDSTDCYMDYVRRMRNENKDR